ncbi:MAG: Asp-tRNA(Asn)/Glu-tRNA(Gln) amidotransferase subunit GatB [Cardiobacteriaceae bacterium]|nr:Asp-tRNA(Asn)/Glu-tRNA(Gln) amidotransferase subunit GatB [Cardiobacteriaceae bacterium]
MKYEAVIGLELHIQLATKSKLFSPAATDFGAQPNDNTNEIDLGYPGVLPVLNRQAVDYACQFAMALNSEVNRSAFFMRKNYFYPDSPKGYQISQLDDAIIRRGQVVLDVEGREVVVRINRGQLEEDAGKSVHDIFSDRSGIDLNRAGVPLIELVSEPDMHSAKEAVAFMRHIHHLVRYLGISDGNMQEGSFRCDANVSLRLKGTQDLNPRVELKNINSFRFVEQAIDIEIERQAEIMDAGGVVEQETRLFDPERQETRTMRSKEEANDYRYFPDPDLLPLDLPESWLEEIKARMPELPDARAARYAKDFSLDSESIRFLLQSPMVGDYFDSVMAIVNDATLVVNWLQGEFSRLLNVDGKDFGAQSLDASRFGGLLLRIKDGTISGNTGKKLLAEMWESAVTADELIAAQGLQQVSDNTQLEAWIDDILVNHPQQVEAFKNGAGKMLGFFVGQVMKVSGGQANPKVVSDLLQRKLAD